MAVFVALTCVSLCIGLHSAGNRIIARVGNSVLKIINIKRTEVYVCAYTHVNLKVHVNLKAFKLKNGLYNKGKKEKQTILKVVLRLRLNKNTDMPLNLMVVMKLIN